MRRKERSPKITLKKGPSKFKRERESPMFKTAVDIVTRRQNQPLRTDESPTILPLLQMAQTTKNRTLIRKVKPFEDVHFQDLLNSMSN